MIPTDKKVEVADRLHDIGCQLVKLSDSFSDVMRVARITPDNVFRSTLQGLRNELMDKVAQLEKIQFEVRP